jgi:hypothetical protein
MRNRIRNGVLAATAAAALAVPVTAAPAAAQSYDCRFMGASYIVQDAVECVFYIYITAIG